MTNKTKPFFFLKKDFGSLFMPEHSPSSLNHLRALFLSSFALTETEAQSPNLSLYFPFLLFLPFFLIKYPPLLAFQSPLLKPTCLCFCRCFSYGRDVTVLFGSVLYVNCQLGGVAAWETIASFGAT